jgi:hypothetical protein
MREAPLTSVFDRWTRPSYERRVRGSTSATYLWGSAGIIGPINFDKPLTLHIRNDVFGQPISLSTTASNSATPTALGTLQPGECVSIPVQNISGVTAICTATSDPLESMVACIIRD